MTAATQTTRRRNSNINATVYTDDQRANALAALAANGGKETPGAISLTARQLGMPDRTLRQWANAERRPQALALSEQRKGDLASAFEVIAWQILDSICPEDFKKEPLSRRMVAAAIAVDKMRLLREQATHLSGQTMDPEARDKRLLELLRAAAERAEAKKKATVQQIEQTPTTVPPPGTVEQPTPAPPTDPAPPPGEPTS